MQKHRVLCPLSSCVVHCISTLCEGLVVGVSSCLILTLFQAATPSLVVLEQSAGVLLDRYN
jgi:hypothetical protein